MPRPIHAPVARVGCRNSTSLSLAARRLAAQLHSAGFDGLELGWVDGIGLPRSRAPVRALLHFPLSHSFPHTTLKSPCAEQGALFHSKKDAVQRHGDRDLICRWAVLLRLRQGRQSERQQVLGSVHLRQGVWLLPVESDRRLLLAQSARVCSPPANSSGAIDHGQRRRLGWSGILPSRILLSCRPKHAFRCRGTEPSNQPGQVCDP